MNRVRNESYGFSDAAVRERGAGPLGILLLALLLCGVFFLSVGAYGIFAAEGEDVREGDLPNAVLVFREFVTENEAVSVVLGLAEEEVADAMTEEDAYLARILAEAAEYIRRHEA